MKILIIAPHCDDAELGAGGAILHHDSHVWVACGENETRIEEAREASRRLHASISHGSHLDGSVDMRDCIHDIEQQIRWTRPGIMFIPPDGDTHQDHRAVRGAAMSAARRQPLAIMEYQTPSAPPGWGPDTWLALTEDDADTVAGILSIYQTQANQHYTQFPQVRARLTANGIAIGAPAAEAYRTVRGIIRGDR